MKRLMRRLSRVADSSLYRPLQTAKGGQRASKGEDRRLRQVPEGHVPVCVGRRWSGSLSRRSSSVGRPSSSCSTAPPRSTATSSAVSSGSPARPRSSVASSSSPPTLPPAPPQSLIPPWKSSSAPSPTRTARPPLHR
ncbi:unnamed protein product, partial [Musa textilis]